MANSATYNRTKVHFSEGAAAATPDASEVVIYAKADGLMYSKDDAGAETLMSSGASLSNPMTTAEDIIKGGASGTPARLALGASNTALASSNSTLAYVKVSEATFAPDSLNASAAPSASNDFTQGWRRGSRWIDTAADKEYICLDESTGAAVWTETTQSGGGTGFIQAQKVTRTAGNVTTTSLESSAWVDVTGMTITMTTGARRCLVVVNVTGINSTGAYTLFDIDIDGTRQGQQYGLSSAHGTAARQANFSFLTDVLTAASHTFKLVFAVSDPSTGTCYAGTVWPVILSVTETGLTS